jgi:SH3-like domain-containing protein
MRRRPHRLPIFGVLAILLALSPLPGGAAPRSNTPSGLPVPRFVSLKYDRTLCRRGPSFEHPVAVTFLRAGLPVKVIAETRDHWRKIVDLDGATCWAHQTTLRSPTHVVLRRDVAILMRPHRRAQVRAEVQKGVIARLEGQREGWRRISASGLEGWAPADALWGLDASPIDVAAHN